MAIAIVIHVYHLKEGDPFELDGVHYTVDEVQDEGVIAVTKDGHNYFIHRDEVVERHEVPGRRV